MSKPAPVFVKCLYSMLSNSTLESIIRWTDDGKNFEILNVVEFEQRILKSYFPNLTFKDFRKKIKTLSFTKLANSGAYVFSHPRFQRFKPLLLGKISSLNAIPSRKKNLSKDDMIVKIRGLESAQIRMEEAVANLEDRYQKIIDLNRFMIGQINEHQVQSEFKRNIILEFMKQKTKEI